jgi:subtilisin family serine protease
MSLGGGASTTLQNAVRYAASRDVVIVAAAGNEGNATLNYPAAYAEVVSVAATDSRDVSASLSNANADVESRRRASTCSRPTTTAAIARCPGPRWRRRTCRGSPR